MTSQEQQYPNAVQLMALLNTQLNWIYTTLTEDTRLSQCSTINGSVKHTTKLTLLMRDASFRVIAEDTRLNNTQATKN